MKQELKNQQIYGDYSTIFKNNIMKKLDSQPHILNTVYNLPSTRSNVNTTGKKIDLLPEIALSREHSNSEQEFHLQDYHEMFIFFIFLGFGLLTLLTSSNLYGYEIYSNIRDLLKPLDILSSNFMVLIVTLTVSTGYIFNLYYNFWTKYIYFAITLFVYYLYFYHQATNVFYKVAILHGMFTVILILYLSLVFNDFIGKTQINSTIYRILLVITSTFLFIYVIISISLDSFEYNVQDLCLKYYGQNYLLDEDLYSRYCNEMNITLSTNLYIYCAFNYCIVLFMYSIETYDIYTIVDEIQRNECPSSSMRTLVTDLYKNTLSYVSVVLGLLTCVYIGLSLGSINSVAIDYFRNIVVELGAVLAAFVVTYLYLTIDIDFYAYDTPQDKTLSSPFIKAILLLLIGLPLSFYWFLTEIKIYMFYRDDSTTSQQMRSNFKYIFGYFLDSNLSEIVSWLSFMAAVYFTLKVITLKYLVLLIADVAERIEPENMAVTVFTYLLMAFILFLTPTSPGAPIYMMGGMIITDELYLTDPKHTQTEVDKSFVYGALISWIIAIAAKVLSTFVLYYIGWCYSDSPRLIAWLGIRKDTPNKVAYLLKDNYNFCLKSLVFTSAPDWPLVLYAGAIQIPILDVIFALFPAAFYYLLFVLIGASLVVQTTATKILGSVCVVLGLLLSFYFMFYFIRKVYFYEISTEDHKIISTWFNTELSTKITEAENHQEYVDNQRSLSSHFILISRGEKTTMIVGGLLSILYIYIMYGLEHEVFRSFTYISRVSEPFHKYGLANHTSNLEFNFAWVLLALFIVTQLFTLYTNYKYHLYTLYFEYDYDEDQNGEYVVVVKKQDSSKFRMSCLASFFGIHMILDNDKMESVLYKKFYYNSFWNDYYKVHSSFKENTNVIYIEESKGYSQDELNDIKNMMQNSQRKDYRNNFMTKKNVDNNESNSRSKSKINVSSNKTRNLDLKQTNDLDMAKLQTKEDITSHSHRSNRGLTADNVGNVNNVNNVNYHLNSNSQPNLNIHIEDSNFQTNHKVVEKLPSDSELKQIDTSYINQKEKEMLQAKLEMRAKDRQIEELQRVTKELQAKNSKLSVKLTEDNAYMSVMMNEIDTLKKRNSSFSNI